MRSQSALKIEISEIFARRCVKFAICNRAFGPFGHSPWSFGPSARFSPFALGRSINAPAAGRLAFFAFFPLSFFMLSLTTFSFLLPLAVPISLFFSLSFSFLFFLTSLYITKTREPSIPHEASSLVQGVITSY